MTEADDDGEALPVADVERILLSDFDSDRTLLGVNELVSMETLRNGVGLLLPDCDGVLNDFELEGETSPLRLLVRTTVAVLDNDAV